MLAACEGILAATAAAGTSAVTEEA
jgi:hypothetical protein